MNYKESNLLCSFGKTNDVGKQYVVLRVVYGDKLIRANG